MNRAQRRNKGNSQVMTFKPVKRKRKAEDAHVEWLWRKIRSGLKLSFDITLGDGSIKRTMSHRTLAKLIALQERAK